MHQKVFLELVDPFKPGLFGFAYRMLRDKEDAKDAMQDLLMKLWNNRQQLEHSKNVRTYCFTTLYHECVDRLRKRNRLRVFADEEMPDVADQARTDQACENDDLIQQIRSAMDNLPYKQKVIMELRDFQCFDYEEIAHMMEMTVNAVRVTVARSHAAISEKMKEEIGYGTGTF